MNPILYSFESINVLYVPSLLLRPQLKLLYNTGSSARCSVTTYRVGWGDGKREGTYVYSWLIHVVVRQKLIQHCKAIIQLKINFKSHYKFCTNILQHNNLKKYVCACAHMVMYSLGFPW